jgi:predicted nucleic acid-binding protein
MKHGKRLPPSDLLIAATALYRGDAIATGNVRHFNRIDELQVYAWP